MAANCNHLLDELFGFIGHIEKGNKFVPSDLTKRVKNPSARWLYLVLWRITSGYGNAERRASIAQLAELAGLTEKTVRTAAKLLESEGFASRVKDGGVTLWQAVGQTLPDDSGKIYRASGKDYPANGKIYTPERQNLHPDLSLNTYNNTNNNSDSDSSDDLNDVFGPVDDSQRDQLVTGDSDTWQDTVDSEQLERAESPAEYIARRWYGAIRGDTAIDLPEGVKARRPWLALSERALSDVSGDVDGLANAIQHFYFEDERDENDFDRGQKNPRDVERLTGAIVRHYNRLEPLRSASDSAAAVWDEAEHGQTFEPAMFEDEALLSEVKLWLKTRCPDPRQYNHLFAHWESLAEPNGVWPIHVRPDALEWLEHGTAAALVEEMRIEFDLPPFEFTSEETSHVA